MAAKSRINLNAIMKITGLLMVIEGLFMLSSLGFSAWYDPYCLDHLRLFDPAHDFLPLLVSGSGIGLVGLILWSFNKKLDQNSIGKREGYIIVSLTWVIISFFGAIPFILSGVTTSYTDAFFETMSGFTTTGATIFTDIEALPKGILFWRSMTHWIGGMGIIVLSLAILPILGIGGMQLFVAEVPGLTPDKLHPRITQTAKRLWIIYVALTLVQTILLMLGGMNLFESLCHAFGTMATGGFGTRNDSIAGFSPYIQYVIIIFMYLAGISFTLHYFTIKRQFSKVFRNEELRVYTMLLITATVIIAAALFYTQHLGPGKAFRDALFQVVSIVTTTGFITSDYLLWPFFTWLLLFLLMFTGGCAGSTGGGIKIVRIILLFKNSRMELKRIVHPQALLPVRLNGKSISQQIIFNVLAFFLIYIIIFAFGSLVMSAMGMEFESAVGAVAASLGNIGPGLGTVGPVLNYSTVPMAGKWVLAFLMLLGRLELFTVLILFSASFWKK
ncbi:Trk-type K+ transport system, membrane component [Lentimicrobium saccharophilum]|uniref:Trk-type K+ transport system, membrane component n=1 Tax=Lentimicrobium saccharophilum TaxID=1678841 RepID=A0A0S7C2B9_9BACT|nr:potassium transporter TrkG [Lentimicrobium saccharophilum]GAP43908.1 Trk-type K+ transport system, membrane component [Lentimicrobium saccharophilum]